MVVNNSKICCLIRHRENIESSLGLETSKEKRREESSRREKYRMGYHLPVFLNTIEDWLILVDPLNREGVIGWGRRSKTGSVACLAHNWFIQHSRSDLVGEEHLDSFLPGGDFLLNSFSPRYVSHLAQFKKFNQTWLQVGKSVIVILCIYLVGLCYPYMWSDIILDVSERMFLHEHLNWWTLNKVIALHKVDEPHPIS